MAREVVERLIDDIDGGEAVETVSFSIDDVVYEIDLNRSNARALRKSLDRYVSAARRVSTPQQDPPKTNVTPNAQLRRRGFDLGQLREWAASNNVAVPRRGRIPNDVVEQYRAAGGR